MDVTAAKKQLGDIIRRARIEQGISQFCLATSLGLESANTISAIELGKQMPDPIYVRKLAAILRLDEERLLVLMLEIHRARLFRRMCGFKP